MTEQDQISNQADTIKALWVQNGRLQARAETQQGMIDWLRDRIAYLEQEQTAQAKAERFFK